MDKFYFSFRFLGLFLVFTILLTPFQAKLAYAQSADEITWSPPVNLSNSDLTSLPGIVSDKNGVVHVIWQDDTLGSTYTQLVDGVWSQPVEVKFPFAEFVPLFVNGGDYVYAFWLNTNTGTLNQSRILADKFDAKGSWEKAKVLAKGVLDYKVVNQGDNALHLAYMTSFDDAKTPAGTYYTRSLDGGVKWDSARPIYTSRYFRALDAKDVNVDIAAAEQDGNQTVYLVWNNPALKRIFLSMSLDGGGNWNDPIEVDGPDLSNATSSPFNPMVTASGSDVLLLWQSNLQSGFACTQNYQYSQDGGTTWSERSRMLSESVGCPQENMLLNTGEDMTLFETTIRDDVYLLAWNGQAWSKAYPQSTLSSFNDPLTNEPVSFRCRQSAIQSGSVLFVVGCNDKGNKDIWVTSREIGKLDVWFPSASLWNDPTMVVDSSNEISSAQAVVDIHGVLHILWRQVDDSEDGNLHRSIHYARFKDTTLSQPARILTSPDKLVEDFSVAYDHNRDRLVVVWTTATTGEMYYSWADVSRAGSTFEWSKAVALPVIRPLAKSPSILITPNGTMYVAYAIPVNEERGIYLISSSDGGVTWSESSQVFGVTDPEWQAIDFPVLASTGDEIIHIIWRRENIIGEAGTVGLYYARSTDHGLGWSAPQNVTSDPVVAASLIDGGVEGVHRFWLSASSPEASFFHDSSLDQGANWRVQDNLTSFGENPGLASPFVDPGGWVNFAQAVESSPNNLVINHQRSSNSRWSILDSLGLGNGSIQEVTSLSAQTLLDGRLVVAYTFDVSEPKEGEVPYHLYVASQSKDAIQSTATAVARLSTKTPPAALPEPTLSPPESASTLSPTESVLPPTPPVILATPLPNGQTIAMDTTTGLALSGGLAILVVVAFFVYTRIRRP